MTVVERCAEFVEWMRDAPLPPEVVHHAKRAVIDWYACLLPGSRVAPAVLLELAGRYLKKPYEPETAYRYYRLLLSRFPDSLHADRARRELGEQFKNRTATPRETN